MGVSLVGLQIENLRGFRSMTLNLERDVCLLVGANNSGKTSLLRLLDWALNTADAELVTGQRDLTSEECELLIPARDARGGARRLTLFVRVADGRRWSRFNAINGVARLRFRVRDNRVFLNLRTPYRSEPLGHEEDARSLLDELRTRTHLTLIPASRDAASRRFRETLERALEGKLREKAVHQAQGGAPTEYRKVSRALTTIKKVSDDLVQPLWAEMQDGVLGLAREGSLTLDAEAGDLVEWMASRVRFRLATGDHDARMVAPVEVGSGLQSLLDLAVLRREEAAEGIDSILAVEEPEAFLHPSAQRTLARTLIGGDGVRRLISTHSALLVDEANYGDVVLVRDHKIFPPRETGDDRRREINTALMTGQGSEAMFCRSLLLVEGEGDKLLFEVLRRRLAAVDQTCRCDELGIVHVGSKASFGPWIRLVESYQEPATGERPIEWLVVADGADAGSDVRRALRDAGIPVKPEMDRAIDAVNQARAAGDDVRSNEATNELNRLAEELTLRINLVPTDLEWCALHSCSDTTLSLIQDSLGMDRRGRDEFLAHLGSKHGRGPVADPRKEPWMRAVIARDVPWQEVSADAKNVLRRWLLGAGLSAGEAHGLLRSL